MLQNALLICLLSYIVLVKNEEDVGYVPDLMINEKTLSLVINITV